MSIRSSAVLCSQQISKEKLKLTICHLLGSMLAVNFYVIPA